MLSDNLSLDYENIDKKVLHVNNELTKNLPTIETHSPILHQHVKNVTLQQINSQKGATTTQTHPTLNSQNTYSQNSNPQAVTGPGPGPNTANSAATSHETNKNTASLDNKLKLALQHRQNHYKPSEILQDLSSSVRTKDKNFGFVEGSLEVFLLDGNSGAQNPNLDSSFSNSITSSQHQNDLEKSAKNAEVICLNKIRLTSICDLKIFQNLTILRLPNNFLSNVDDIQFLHNLIWLDLHNNQITSFPKVRYFWRNMSNLLVLNLHDNLFKSYLDLQSVSGIKNLTALTVYNTPMSVENAIQIHVNKNKNVINYRHQLVNSCFNLKALDHHLVSDEEIVEHLVIDKSMGKFKVLGHALRVDLCPSLPVYAEGSFNREQNTLTAYRERFCFSDTEITGPVNHPSVRPGI